MNDDLYIKDCGSYYTVINNNGGYSNHCHVENRRSAELLKKQVERKIVPRGSYFRSCALRVTTDDSYKEKINIKIAKDKDRQFFYRVNRRLKK